MELIEEYLSQNEIEVNFLVKKDLNSFTFILKNEIYYSIEIKKIGNGYRIYPLYESHNNTVLMEKEDVFDDLDYYLHKIMGLYMAKKLQRKLEDTTRFSFYFKVEDIYPYSVFISKRNINEHFSIRTNGNKYITDSSEEYDDIEELLNELIL